MPWRGSSSFTARFPWPGNRSSFRKRTSGSLACGMTGAKVSRWMSFRPRTSSRRHARTITRPWRVTRTAARTWRLRAGDEDLSDFLLLCFSRGQLATAEAALNQARKIYDRRAELFKLGAIPARDLLVSQTELANANANYEVARRSLELLETHSREKDIRIAESRVAQARARLAQVEALLQFTELRAPFAGTITEQLLYPGDMAKPETSLFTVMDLAVAVARAQVPEAEAREIRLKQRCDFMPADSKDKKFGGKVSLVNKAVDPARRTVEVWCDLQNPDRWLRAGVFGAVDIVTGTAPKSILVPQSAVQFVEGTRSGAVLVVDGKRVAHKREVETGMISQGKVQIRSGLRAGELVVVEGGYGLPDGTEVRILETDK